MVDTYNLSTQVVETGRERLGIHGCSWLHSKSTVSLGYIIPCLKIKLGGPAENDIVVFESCCQLICIEK